MDRVYYHDSDCCVSETYVSFKGVHLYDGDDKTHFDREHVSLSPYHLHFASPSRPQFKLLLDLQCILRMEEESGFMKSRKIVLHLCATSAARSNSVAKSSASHIKLSFTEGGLSSMKAEMEKMLAAKMWTKLEINKKVTTASRSGIVGIERKMQEKIQQSATNISVAFQDLKMLMDMAKDMVRLANVMSNKIKDRQGNISDDETVAFKSYLLSLGISDPVTRESCSSGDTYRKQLAKQISDFLLKPISEIGGMMALSDAYCRVNRARGLDLLSPEDFLQSCKQMQPLNLPVKLRTFDSGVCVLQLQSQSDRYLDQETEKLLKEKKTLTAEELSQLINISVLLARERLISAEKCGLACRDDTVRGLLFYPNLFISTDPNPLS